MVIHEGRGGAARGGGAVPWGYRPIAPHNRGLHPRGETKMIQSQVFAHRSICQPSRSFQSPFIISTQAARDAQAVADGAIDDVLRAIRSYLCAS